MKKKKPDNAEKVERFNFWIQDPEIRRAIAKQARFKITGMESDRITIEKESQHRLGVIPEDIAQELYIHLWKNWAKIENYGLKDNFLRSLIKKIIGNKRKDLYKEKRRKEMIEKEDKAGKFYEKRTISSTRYNLKSEGTAGPFENLSEDRRLNKATSQFINNFILGFDIGLAIENLSKEEKKLLELAESYTVREIAEKIGKPKTTVGRKIKGIRNKMKKHL